MTLACARRAELGIVFLGSLGPNHNHLSTLYVRIKAFDLYASASSGSSAWFVNRGNALDE